MGPATLLQRRKRRAAIAPRPVPRCRIQRWEKLAQVITLPGRRAILGLFCTFAFAQIVAILVMEKTKQRFTAKEAQAITRVFMAIERQINIAFREGREGDAKAMAKLTGILEVKVFGYCHELWEVA